MNSLRRIGIESRVDQKAIGLIRQVKPKSSYASDVAWLPHRPLHYRHAAVLKKPGRVASPGPSSGGAIVPPRSLRVRVRRFTQKKNTRAVGTGYHASVVVKFESDWTPFLQHFESGHFWVGPDEDLVRKINQRFRHRTFSIFLYRP
jgi:hypothetical protein